MSSVPGGPVLTALAGQMDELAAVLAPLDDAGWAAPSRCEGWSVCDVVLHLAQTNEMALGSLQGRYPEVLDELAAGLGWASSADEGAGMMVERQRGASGPEVRDRWQAGVDGLLAAFGEIEPRQRVQWVVGQLSAQTLATTRLAETWIHTGDVTFAFGDPPSATERLWHIARLAWRTLPYAFERAGRQMAGPVAFVLRAPGGDTWTFEPDDGEAPTRIEGDALDLCLVAAQRADAADTGLDGRGPDADAVLALVRTFA
jgi:uncharacterized protein (TIGR03084 family)